MEVCSPQNWTPSCDSRSTPANSTPAIDCASKCMVTIAEENWGTQSQKVSATVVEHDRRITGYATVIGFFGHAVGETNKDLKALIGAAKEFAGPGFLLPTRNGELFRWCLSNGLRIEQPMTLMTKGLLQRTSRSIPAIDLVLAGP